MNRTRIRRLVAGAAAAIAMATGLATGVASGVATGVTTGVASGVAGAPADATPAHGVPTSGAAPALQARPVAERAVRITSDRLPGAVRSSAYRATLRAVGGRAPLRWSLVDGTLPRGLRLSPSGVVSGTPGASGAGSVVVRVRDARGATASRRVQLAVVPRGGLLLDPTRMGPVAVGGSPNATVKGLSRLLGTPTRTNNTNVACEFGGPSHGYLAAWGDFQVVGSAPQGQPIRMTKWSITGTRLPAKIAPRDGIAPGSTLKALLARYPHATVDRESPFAGPDLLVNSGSMYWWVDASTKRVTTATLNPEFCD